MKKGIIKLILLVLAASVFLCSCGATAEVEVFDEDLIGTDSGYDLEGYTIKYICGLEDTFLGYEEDTFFYDMAKQRVSDVEKELNCKVNAQNVQTNDLTAMMTATASGVYYGDAFSWEGDMLEDAAAAGLLVGLSSVSDYLDIKDSDKWGTKYQLESICYNDDVYGFIPYLWPERSYSEMGYFITINEDVVSKIGGTDPREYVENRQWVWSQFRECLAQFTVTEGSETSIYAIPTDDGGYAHMYIRSNGSRLVSVSANGTITNGFTDEKTMKAMQEAVDVKKEYAYAFSKTSQMDSIIEDLAAGKLAMAFIDCNNLLTKVAYKVDNFGIVKWPTGPDVDPDYVFSTYSNIRPTSISILTPDAGATALILDKIYEPFEGYETQEKIHDYMKSGVFFDDRDCDTFFGMIENTQYNYFHFGVFGLVSGYVNGSSSIAQSVESMEDRLEDIFEENIAPCVEGIIAVYGSYGD